MKASGDGVPPDIGVYLSHTVAEWFRHNPKLRLLTVVPICRHGHTVELHAWYEAHPVPPAPPAFPPASPLAPATSK